MARVLVVEDDPAMAELIAFALREEGHEVTIAIDAERALPLFVRTRPEALVIDVGLPGRSGLDLCQTIRETSRVPVLFLTSRSLLQDKVRGFRVGGDDYVLKPFAATELTERVAALLRRSAWTETLASTVEIDGLTISSDGSVTRGGKPLGLSADEIEIILALASTRGAPWTAERLMRRLNLPVLDGFRTAETIYRRISRLRRKVERDHREPRVILTERGVGWVMPADEPGI